MYFTNYFKALLNSSIDLVEIKWGKTFYSLLVICSLLLVTFYSLLLTFSSLLVAFYSLLVTRSVLLLTCYFLLVTRYFLLVTFYSFVSSVFSICFFLTFFESTNEQMIH